MRLFCPVRCVTVKSAVAEHLAIRATVRYSQTCADVRADRYSTIGGRMTCCQLGSRGVRGKNLSVVLTDAFSSTKCTGRLKI